jgi:hypothetical protein
VVALAACNKPGPPPGSADALVAYLETVVGADEATRQREAARWQLDAAAWDHTVVEVYRPLHADYQQAFAAALPALVAQLAHPGPVTVRRHYAGDPRLTLAQSRNRWALPTLYPSLVAEAGGVAIDAVFIPPGPPSPPGPDGASGPDGRGWRVLVGLDAVVRARVAALDAHCAANLALAGPTGRCTEVGAAIADAALRTQPERLAHVCRLADTLCGKESP